MTAANHIGWAMLASLFIAAFVFVWREEGLRCAFKFFGAVTGIIAFGSVALHLIGYQP